MQLKDMIQHVNIPFLLGTHIFLCACFLNDLQYILTILLVFIYLRCTTMEVQINVFLLLAFTILPNQNACLSKGNHSQ